MMITHSEVRDYCLGIVQVIPVFLIALTVLDANNYKIRYDKAIKYVRGQKEEADRISEEVLSKTPKARQNRVGELEVINKNLVLLDKLDPLQVNEDLLKGLEVHRSELIAERDRNLGESAEIARLSETIADLRAEVSVFPQKLESITEEAADGYAQKIVGGVLLGVVGEVLALWGAVGLLDNRYVLAIITSITVFIIEALVLLAIDRLTPYPSRPFYRFYYQSARSLLAMAALATLVLVIISIKIKG